MKYMKDVVCAVMCAIEILFVLYSLIESEKTNPNKEGIEDLFRKYVPILIVLLSVSKLASGIVPSDTDKLYSALRDAMVPFFLIYIFSIGEIFNTKKWLVILILFCAAAISSAAVLGLVLM